MPVEPVSDSVGNLRGLVNHKRDWTRGSFLRAEKRCERGTDENQDMSFHLLSLLFIDWTVATTPLFDFFGKNSALSRVRYQLTCAVDDQRQTDHRSSRYSGTGGQTRADAGRIRTHHKNSRACVCGYAGAWERDLAKEADVNLAQRILTIAFLIAFVATVIWCPWTCGRGYVYSPFWIPPPCVFAVSDIFWSQLLIEWVGLAVIYAGLRAVLK